jgi:hydrogenase expression/formation protein HypD
MKFSFSKILKEIEKKASLINRPLTFMELCGTHSQTIAAFGLKKILPKNLSLIAGPGCPVCVTSQRDVESVAGLALARIPIATYGDTLKIFDTSVLLKKNRGSQIDISVVYDITEALRLKSQKPNLVFWGIGFETTAPMSAWAIKKGLTVYSTHKKFFPAMKTLLQNRELKIDGFINPGHVSAITGTKIYENLRFPQVVAGFEPEDVLQAISWLLDQIISKKPRVQNEYKRVVKREGNKRAQKIIQEVFEVKDSFWRGLGKIKKSGLVIRKKYRAQDAEYVYSQLLRKIRKKIILPPSACQCGKILQGIYRPQECPLFAKICQPENPQGPCMVSVEGACHIEYKYGEK